MKEQVRLTFDDVKQNQILLIEKLRMLIKENRLLDESEKYEFMDMFSMGLVGEGRNGTLFLKLKEGKVLIGTQDDFIREMLCLGTETVNVTYNKKEIIVEIKDLWKAFLDHVLM